MLDAAAMALQAPIGENSGMLSFVTRSLACIALVLCVEGCSLISLKSPERPLSTRDLNTRVLTREFSYHFVNAVSQRADDIAASETDPRIVANTLRWKIGAATESERAVLRLAPSMSLLDSWALAAQMKAFLSPGSPGGDLFGSHQGAALSIASELNEDAQELAHRLIPAGELRRYQEFVDMYTRENPITSLDFVRASIVDLWAEHHGGDVKLVDTLGTIPEAMTDVTDRLKITTDSLASQTMWRTQLALRDSGYSGNDIRSALRQLDEHLAKVATTAQDAPELMHQAVADVRQSVFQALDRIDKSSSAIIDRLSAEREALTAELHTEREAVVDAADVQRKALAQDVSRIADQVVKSSGEQVRSLAREVLALLIVLAIVVLGLPFWAGYMVGRTRRNRE
jgi:hypothetical protein